MFGASELSIVEDGDDYGLFPAGWKCPYVPGMIVNVQQFLFSQTSEVAGSSHWKCHPSLGLSCFLAV